MSSSDDSWTLAWYDDDLGMALDPGCMRLDETDLRTLEPKMHAAFEAMTELEAGAIANPDEGRMVGHYWLRSPELAPDEATSTAVQAMRSAVAELAAKIHSGAMSPERGERFLHAVVVGIGGSSLGPLLVAEALGVHPERGLTLHFVDNTDPDGIDRLVAALGEGIDSTLCVVISKSGGTKETRNGMLEMAAAYEARGLSFGKHAVAITSDGSKLDAHADAQGFLAKLPMWDWVGGRTSVTSAVGLFPAALQGADVDALMAGARAMDALTRQASLRDNPAALLAACWHHATDGQAKRAMVMLPYKDRLALTSRYLQQLVMESIGKAESVSGETVHQGITVYGNKGSTDQHAYVQQLYDGPDDFFVTFIEVLRDRDGDSLEVEPGVTSGDYLSGFLQGTRNALASRGRRSLTLTLEAVDARRLGAVIALYERAVGLYASLVGVNAYHQPAVELGKKAAGEALALQARIVEALAAGTSGSPSDIAAALDGANDKATYSILRHLAANGRVQVLARGGPPWQWRYGVA
jgi:glucose-6-phosphate isomerase